MNGTSLPPDRRAAAERRNEQQGGSRAPRAAPCNGLSPPGAQRRQQQNAVAFRPLAHGAVAAERCLTLAVDEDERLEGNGHGIGEAVGDLGQSPPTALAATWATGDTVLLRGHGLRDREGETPELRTAAESELPPPTGDLVVALTVESSLRGTHHLPTVRGNLLARRGHFGEARLPFQGDGLEEWVGDGFVASGTGNADDKKAISSLGSY